MGFVKQHMRSFTMVLALIVIWMLFGILTDGVFFEARNLSNLFRQMADIAILAVGMALIIISGNIDLSVGSIVGVTGALAALVQVKWLGPYLFDSFEAADPDLLSLWLALAGVAAALLLGAVIGLVQGLWVAYGKVPAFIVTLAGMLVFRGAILGITEGVTVSPVEPVFKAFGQSYLSPGMGWIVAAGAALLFMVLMQKWRRDRLEYGLSVKPLSYHIAALLALPVLVAVFVAIMNQYRGIPIPVIILLVIATCISFAARNTPFGRYIYAIGGNRETARLSGINIPRIILINFVIMGLLCGVAGVILTARLDAATINAGNMFELSAIAACVIGGCSVSGGSGTVWGTMVGALVMASLDNGMSLMNIESFWQQIVKGLVLLVAVWVDISSRSSAEQRG
jgi:D-xylose transport system permease protein